MRNFSFLMSVFFCFTLYESKSQTLTSEIDSLWSFDILIQTSLDSLYTMMSAPDLIDSVHRCRITYPKKDGKWFDTTLYYKLIYYFDKGLTYAEKDNRVCISAIEFYKNKLNILHTNKIDLNWETQIKDIVSIFHLGKKEIIKEKLRLLEYDSPYFYTITLSRGFSPTDIQLIFDKKKKLLFISILPIFK